MVSVLRQLQAEWNALVPQAQALNIRRVRPLNAPLETIDYRRGKVEWLRGEIARLTATTSLTPTPAQEEAYRLDIHTFGVELEIIMPHGMTRHRVAELLCAVGVRCEAESYNHHTGPHWKIVTDGSLGDYSRGAELVSPPLRGEDGLAQLTKACEVLKGVGCKVNRRCGFHVHVGARNWDVPTFRNLVALYTAAEPAIDSLMAPSRRADENTYCRSLRIDRNRLVRAASVEQVAQAMGQSSSRDMARGSSRYRKLNLQSFWQHGTVEFRHHQGTVEAEKATNWVKLCLRMCAAAADHGWMPPSYPMGWDALCSTAKVPAEERTYFEGRAEYFRRQLARTETRSRRGDRGGIAGPSALIWGRGVAPIVTDPASIPTALQVDPLYRELTRPVADNSAAVFTEVGEDLQRRSTTRGS